MDLRRGCNMSIDFSMNRGGVVVIISRFYRGDAVFDSGSRCLLFPLICNLRMHTEYSIRDTVTPMRKCLFLPEFARSCLSVWPEGL
jgi:hypothetical protein